MTAEERLVHGDGSGDAAGLAASRPAHDRDLGEGAARTVRLPARALPEDVVLLLGQGQAVEGTQQGLLRRTESQVEELRVLDELDDGGSRHGSSSSSTPATRANV